MAWRAAEELERRLSPRKATILRRHQLVPELAEDLRHYDTVIFVDAAVAANGSGRPGEVRVEEVQPEQSPVEVHFSHQFRPGTLLAMAGQLYNAKPRAFCVTVTGENFEHGELLSKSVESSLPELLGRIEGLIREPESRAVLGGR